MKKIVLLFLLLAFGNTSVYANVLQTEKKQACEKLLKIAENKQIEDVYEICGFNDEDIAWYEWAPLMSATENKKALYELCHRYPAHDYAHLYCQKSADLGYVPAFYWLAKEALKNDEKNLYQNYLEKIIETNDIKNKTKLITESDFITRQAYEDLAKIYLDSTDVKSREKGLRYLQIAADAGLATAAHTLGVLLYWNPAVEQQALSQKYLWKAILLGCPAAEENLELMRLSEQGRVYSQDAREVIESRLYTCQPTDFSADSTEQVFKLEDCDCPQVLSWFDGQRKKPFLVSRIVDKSAILKDPAGAEYSVVKGDKVTDGFVVEEVRTSAVIVRRMSERYILLYRPDAQCVELCANPNVIPKSQLKNLSPYKLKFTQDECQNLAQNIENLNNPLSPFKGLPECQLQDWQRWGEGALAEKRNKHLFLLANYEQSDYIPSLVARAEIMTDNDASKYATISEELLLRAIQTPATDELSDIKKEQAYCILTKRYMNENLFDKAFALAQEGSDKKYPQSVNMLGVLYAVGLGTEQNFDTAAELFLKADDLSQTPFISARENYKNIETEKNLGSLTYGLCREIAEPSSVSVDKLLELY